MADVSKMELHGFADASGRAYAAVIYLRVLFRDGNIMNRFVAAKTRVAPIKVMTIPRLELMACLILSRLIKTISEALVVFKLDRIFCWSDSVDCICWINTKHKVWKRFVQNRVNEIRCDVEEATWKYCPGMDNPADIPSRGIDITRTDNQNKWLEGPTFLNYTHELWPTLSNDEIIADGNRADTEEIVSVNATIKLTSPSIEEIIKKHSFHSFKKLIRITCYVK